MTLLGNCGKSRYIDRPEAFWGDNPEYSEGHPIFVNVLSVDVEKQQIDLSALAQNQADNPPFDVFDKNLELAKQFRRSGRRRCGQSLVTTGVG